MRLRAWLNLAARRQHPGVLRDQEHAAQAFESDDGSSTVDSCRT
jgi:hypothetical protein